MPEAIARVDVSKQGQPAEHYMAVRDLEGLIALVQLGALEIHPWGARRDRIERPDRLIFDLDPGPGVTWDRLKSAAVELRDILEQIDLRSFVKTTGGKGLHLVVPIRRTLDWDQAKAVTRAIASAISASQPKQYIAVNTKSRREGRIFIDYLRNGRGATAVAAYSTRARPGAAVSAPIEWEQLDRLESADQFTIANLPDRLAGRQEDPWTGFDAISQTVSKDVLRLLDIEESAAKG
jgi:bifunctional non-homologous end joining protein LigD